MIMVNVDTITKMIMTNVDMFYWCRSATARRIPTRAQHGTQRSRSYAWCPHVYN